MSEPKGGYVLVVDDLADQREIYRNALQFSGYRVLEAGDGETAVRLACAHLPDVVLLDIALPDVSGFEVAKRLRMDRRTARISVVALTGYVLPENARRAMDAGFDEFLTKPVAPREAIAAVQRQLDVAKTRGRAP